MSDYQTFCGFDRKSTVLDGAISARADFLFLARSYDEENGYDEDFDFTNISNYLPDDFYLDKDNDIIVGPYGAVLDAFDLADVDDLDNEILNIVIDYQMKYPEYELEVEKGVFPLDTISTDSMFPDLLFSTHVLYIKNYEDIIENNKEYIEEQPKVKSFLKKDFY